MSGRLAVGAFVAAGSRHESVAEHGLSHLLEHMAFKGTRRRSAREIAEAIEDVGGDLNAETGVERTGYFARVIGSDVGLALDVLGDILTDSLFDAAELEREKNVIVQEIGAVEDTPDDYVFDLLTANAWPDQAVGRPILGTRERVGGFDREAIDRYLQTALRRVLDGGRRGRGGRSRRDRRTGPFASRRPAERGAGAARAGRLSRRGSAASSANSSRRMSSSPSGAGQSGRRTMTRRRCLRPQPGAACRRACSRRSGKSVASPIRIYSFHWDYADTGLFGVYAGSADRDAAEVVAASLVCLAEAAHTLAEVEIRRAKAQMKVSILAALESPAARAQQLARQMQIYGRPLSLDEMIARVDAISAADVRKTGAAMLKSPPTVATIGAVAKVPGRAQVAEALRGV